MADPALRLVDKSEMDRSKALEAALTQIERAGCFPEPAVAWLAPGTTPAPLAALRARTAAALRAAGFPFDEREWRPHVTTARRCRETPAWRGPPIEWHVDDAVLCRSEGTDAGVRYAVVARTASTSVR